MIKILNLYYMGILKQIIKFKPFDKLVKCIYLCTDESSLYYITIEPEKIVVCEYYTYLEIRDHQIKSIKILMENFTINKSGIDYYIIHFMVIDTIIRNFLKDSEIIVNCFRESITNAC